VGGAGLGPERAFVVRRSGHRRWIKGYTSEEIIGEHFSRFYTDEERGADILKQALRMAAETGRFSQGQA